MELDDFRTLIEDAGYEACSDYSGRAMYGATCLSVTLDSDQTTEAFVADVMYQAALDSDGVTTLYDLSQAFKACRTDSMGRGTVIYFPRFDTSGIESAL